MNLNVPSTAQGRSPRQAGAQTARSHTTVRSSLQLALPTVFRFQWNSEKEQDEEDVSCTENYTSPNFYLQASRAGSVSINSRKALFAWNLRASWHSRVGSFLSREE